MPEENKNEDQKTAEEQIAEANAAMETAKAEAKTAKEALESQKVTVKIDGEEKIMTMEEARAAISKSGGADKRFREAAEKEKSAERGMRIDSLFSQINAADSPDPKLVSELAGLIGVNPKEILPAEGNTEPKKPDRKLTLEDFDDSLKQQFDFTNQQNIEAAKQKIYEEVKKGVDKDEIFGRMNSVAKEAGNEDFLTTAADEVHEDVLRKISSGEPFGADMIASSIQAKRARFKRYGIPEKVTKPKTIIMGLGQPGGEPMSIQPDEPIERVESSEAGYAENFAKRAFQMLARGQASKT